MNEILHRKGKTEKIIMSVSRIIKEEENEVDGINNACRIINEIMNV